jgi:mRNA-degrading endonuclease RelE of RelBE toxin-antitoxin system
MRLRRTQRFKEAYLTLPAQEQERVKKALKLLETNWRHPSLRVKKIRGAPGIWEARVSRSCRLTFQLEGDVCLLRNVGEHDKTLKNP